MIYFIICISIIIIGGCAISDPRVTKLVALAADKFLAEIINESKEFHALRKTKTNKRKSTSSTNLNNSLEMVSNNVIQYFKQLITCIVCIFLRKLNYAHANNLDVL